MPDFYVYILASPSRTLYIGVTNALERRVWEHKTGFRAGFTKRYNVTRLVHIETYASLRDAIARERQLKGWTRARKVALIAERNPRWYDLAHDWHAPVPPGETGAAAPGDPSAAASG